MTEPWSHATFTVRPGREDEFRDTWTALARRARADFGASPTLLRSVDRPNVFLGFGLWPDIDAMERFRSETADMSAPLDGMLEGADAHLCEKVFP